MMLVAGLILFAVLILLMGKFVLSWGVLLNQGGVFMTHNVSFTTLATGALRLKARGGKLTDSFDLTVSPEEIDLLAFSCGHRPMNKRLDKAGYRVYRLIHWQKSGKHAAIKIRIGDFTLHPKAQKRFKEFTSKLLNEQFDHQVQQWT